jgi:hypothetical protein
MTVYYRGPEVLITDQVFTVLLPDPLAFAIDGLDDVHVLAGGRRRLFGPRAYELRATYRDVGVLLFSSRDERAFGQVKRGLVRALEGRRAQREQYRPSVYR